MKHRSKYVSGPDRELAVAQALRHFGCKEECLVTEVMREGSESAPWTILAICCPDGNLAAADNLNGSFALYYEEEGVYLELYPGRGAGMAVSREEASNYIKRKELKGLNPAEVLGLLGKGWGRLKIAPPQEEKRLDEGVAVFIPEGDMEAAVKILAPDEGGAPIGEDAVRERLAAAGVTVGIDGGAIARALSERVYGKLYVVARGIPSEPGKDARIVFHFPTEKGTGRPKEGMDGKIDYHNLDLFFSVEQGQLLVERVPATAGLAGQTVRGRQLVPKAGRDKPLPKSKNAVANEEKTALYAAKSGMVEYISGAVVVADVYTVKGDCDLGVGNIDFDGSVVISGNVLSGLSVKATGSISVGGVVEGAVLEAGGDIELKRGIQGMDKGRVKAGGSIVAQFIERAAATADGSITADVVIHSTVEAGALRLKGKRGSIMGGLARVGGDVVATTVGSVAHTQTDIEVGLLPQKRARMQTLEKELQRLSEEDDKLHKLINYLNIKKEQAGQQDESRDRLLLSAQGNIRQNRELFESYSSEMELLEVEAENAVSGKVHVLDTAFPGTKISIASGYYKVTQQTQFATFKLVDGQVAFVPCEAGRG